MLRLLLSQEQCGSPLIIKGCHILVIYPTQDGEIPLKELLLLLNTTVYLHGSFESELFWMHDGDLHNVRQVVLMLCSCCNKNQHVVAAFYLYTAANLTKQTFSLVYLYHQHVRNEIQGDIIKHLSA